MYKVLELHFSNGDGLSDTRGFKTHAVKILQMLGISQALLINLLRNKDSIKYVKRLPFIQLRGLGKHFSTYVRFEQSQKAVWSSKSQKVNFTTALAIEAAT